MHHSHNKNRFEEMGAIYWMLQGWFFFYFFLLDKASAAAAAAAAASAFSFSSRCSRKTLYSSADRLKRNKNDALGQARTCLKGVFPLIYLVIIVRKDWSFLCTTQKRSLLHSLLDFWTDRKGRAKTSSSPWHLQSMPWCVDGIINC